MLDEIWIFFYHRDRLSFQEERNNLRIISLSKKHEIETNENTFIIMAGSNQVLEILDAGAAA